MKKFFRIWPVMVLALLGLSVAACDDDKDDSIDPEKLPSQVTAFISAYFPSESIVSTRKDNNEYEVTLSDGTEIEFNKEGQWTDVDAVAGNTIPSGFYPEAIDTYVATNYSATGINEISKELYGYDVELVTGKDLSFTAEGTFLPPSRYNLIR